MKLTLEWEIPLTLEWEMTWLLWIMECKITPLACTDMRNITDIGMGNNTDIGMGNNTNMTGLDMDSGDMV